MNKKKLFKIFILAVCYHADDDRRGKNGIRLHGCAPTIVHNIIVYAKDAGISLADGSRPDIKNNDFYRNDSNIRSYCHWGWMKNNIITEGSKGIEFCKLSVNPYLRIV